MSAVASSSTSSPARTPAELGDPAGGAGGAATVRPKRKGKASALLRDYYGLGGGLSTANEDPTDPDSASFDPKAAYNSIVSTSSLPQLLKRECDLLTEIRELDGERQSLVYNHHHELIAASETIARMKACAESLDGSLDALRTSFSTISQLFSELAVPRPGASKPPLSRTNSKGGDSALAAAGTAAPSASGSAQAESSAQAAGVLDVRIEDRTGEGEGAARTLRLDAQTQAELLTIVELPTRLRDALLAHSGRGAVSGGADADAGNTRADAPAGEATPRVTRAGLDEAEKLWGQGEPLIARWLDAGVQDVKAVAAECRAILRDAAAAVAG